MPQKAFLFVGKWFNDKLVCMFLKVEEQKTSESSFMIREMCQGTEGLDRLDFSLISR